MRNLHLPLKPAIQSSIAGTGRRLYADAAVAGAGAQCVYILRRLRRHACPTTTSICCPVSRSTSAEQSRPRSQQLQQALKVMSLTDAFFDERPSYREHAVIAERPNPRLQTARVQAVARHGRGRPSDIDSCRSPESGSRFRRTGSCRKKPNTALCPKAFAMSMATIMVATMLTSGMK